jgi:hypothetical protein
MIHVNVSVPVNLENMLYFVNESHLNIRLCKNIILLFLFS